MLSSMHQVASFIPDGHTEGSSKNNRNTWKMFNVPSMCINQVRWHPSPLYFFSFVFFLPKVYLYLTAWVFKRICTWKHFGLQHLHVQPHKLYPNHTTPEKFENSVFTLKTHQMFSTHTTPLIIENLIIIDHFWICVWWKILETNTYCVS